MYSMFQTRRTRDRNAEKYSIENIEYPISNELCKYQEISLDFLRKSLDAEA